MGGATPGGPEEHFKIAGEWAKDAVQQVGCGGGGGGEVSGGYCMVM